MKPKQLSMMRWFTIVREFNNILSLIDQKLLLGSILKFNQSCYLAQHHKNVKISWTGNLAWNDVQASKSNQELKKNLCGPVVWIEFSVWMIVSNSLWINMLSIARPSACWRHFLKKKRIVKHFFWFCDAILVICGRTKCGQY